MKKIIVFFCMMLNVIAYGMNDGEDVSVQLSVLEERALAKASGFGDELRGLVATVVMPMHEAILGNNFETLIESNDDAAIDQIWNQERGRVRDNLTKSVGEMNIDGENYLWSDERGALRQVALRVVDLYCGEQGKKDLAVNIKFVRNIYAINKANKTQASSSSTHHTIQ